MKPGLLLAVLFCSPVFAQVGPAFDVAVVKQSPEGPRNKGIGPRARQLEGMNVSVVDMLTFSFGIHRTQIVGAPPWAESRLFDFVGQPGGEGPVDGQQWRSMLLRLLMDRFQLTYHREKREMPAFALRATGRKVTRTPSSRNPEDLPNFGVGNGNVVATNVGMADFAHILQEALLDRPVVDQTKIPGKFDFTLKWTPDAFQHGQQAPTQTRPDMPPSLYEAIQEQLGIKIQTTKAVVDVIVIDKVEQPSAN